MNNSSNLVKPAYAAAKLLKSMDQKHNETTRMLEWTKKEYSNQSCPPGMTLAEKQEQLKKAQIICEDLIVYIETERSKIKQLFKDKGWDPIMEVAEILNMVKLV